MAAIVHSDLLQGFQSICCLILTPQKIISQDQIMIKWFFIWVFCFCDSKCTIYIRFKSILIILKIRFLCGISYAHYLKLLICTVYWNCCSNWYFRNLWKHGSPFELNHDREGPSTFWRNLVSEYLHFFKVWNWRPNLYCVHLKEIILVHSVLSTVQTQLSW